MLSPESVAPTPMTVGKLPGVPADPELGPEFPLAKTGMMPKDLQVMTASQKVRAVLSEEPQEFETTLTLTPESATRLANQSKHASIQDSSPDPHESNPFAATNMALYATPMSSLKGPGPSPPTIVPMVWVPWP